jgi:hypothetical protein
MQHLRPSLRDLARTEVETTLRSLASLDGDVIDLEEVGSQLEDAANLCAEVRRHLAITDAGEDNVVLKADSPTVSFSAVHGLLKMRAGGDERTLKAGEVLEISASTGRMVVVTIRPMR